MSDIREPENQELEGLSGQEKSAEAPGNAAEVKTKKPKRRKTGRIVAIIIIVALVALAIFRVTSSGRRVMMPPAELAINVSTVTVEEGTLDSYVTLSGTIAPKSEIYVVPRVSGKVTAVYVELGQWVNKGQTLFSIDKTDVQAQLSSASAALESARAAYERTVGGTAEQTIAQLNAAVETSRISYEQAQNALERTEALYQAGGATQQAYEQAKSACDLANQQYQLAQTNYDLTVNKILGENEKSARAALTQAQAAYQTAQNAYNDTEVKAEVSGYIGMSTVAVGGMVSQASPPMSIVDISEVYAEVGLPETVINSIDGTQTVTVEVASMPGEVFTGTIAGISPQTSAGTQTYLAKIAIPNESGELKGGMFASVKFRTDSAKGVLYLPVSAVKDSMSETYVYVVGDDKRAHKQTVTEGLANDEYVEITSGLKVGDEVVVRGQDFLEDGTLVEVVDDTEAS
ncbi:MAG: efflux RND transporter periplasmic adaptor subunit [Clostridia bacterium]|nr:efflux RND transporter periplasmic adaptor subunit [Clostridia bacterium]